MPSLPQDVLLAKLRGGLPARTTFLTQDLHPCLVRIPRFGPARIYLWTITHVESNDRPLDEFKIQLILPGQARTARGELDTSNDVPTFLLGYSPDFGVFVAWETRLHAEFSFSAAVQVKEETLDEARSTGWSVARPRGVRGGPEVRVAFTPGNLLHYLRLAKKADDQRSFGTTREALFLAHTPNVRGIELPTRERDSERLVDRVRQRLATFRLERDRRFGPLVKQQYAYACAVCTTELEIVEGAHIIPANEKHGEDKIWNGVALCPNHHKLFDANTFIIKPDLRISVDHAAIDFFRESGRSQGMDQLLLRFDSQVIREPFFFQEDGAFRRKMLWALRWREDMAGVEAA